MTLNIFRNSMLNNNPISKEDVNESKYRNGSSKFRKLSAAGSILELIHYVYLAEDPYIDYVPSKSRLARNALSFFCSNSRKEAIEKFFESPFIKDITHDLLQDSISSLVYNDNVELLTIVREKSPILFTEKDDDELFLLACKSNSINIIQSLLQNEISNIAQKKKLEYFITLLSNKTSEKTLNTFKFLELKFSDLLYHQSNDLLMSTALLNDQKEVVNYLLFDKKLRLTKHINMLGYCNQEFAKLLTKRKLFDSLIKKSENHFDSMDKSIHKSIHKSIQNIKL